MRNKRILYWEKKFQKRLKKFHKNFWKRAFLKIMKKSSNLRTSLKRRSREYDTLFKISLEEIREIIFKYYGKGCTYCSCNLTVANIVCDHIQPISNGGDSTPSNLQIICRRCNVRKGNLSHKDFKRVLKWINKQPKDVSKYILRKLSKGDNFR
jgi:5-methylcytosine-specific restriction endonuclease McrA